MCEVLLVFSVFWSDNPRNEVSMCSCPLWSCLGKTLNSRGGWAWLWFCPPKLLLWVPLPSECDGDWGAGSFLSSQISLMNGADWVSARKPPKREHSCLAMGAWQAVLAVCCVAGSLLLGVLESRVPTNLWASAWLSPGSPGELEERRELPQIPSGDTALWILGTAGHADWYCPSCVLGHIGVYRKHSCVMLQYPGFPSSLSLSTFWTRE